jgi:hypothetical protein
MRKMFRGASLGVTFALSASFAASVTFGDEIGKSRDDHDIALKAVERGEILPLETVLSEVGKTIHGELLVAGFSFWQVGRVNRESEPAERQRQPR